MAFREKLIADIRAYFKQCKWEDMLQDQIIELLEMRPASPYIYIQKKISLRSKLDNTKHSSFLTELLIYCLFVNALEVDRTQIENRILYLCVDKYQHTKIRRTEAMNILNGLFSLASVQEVQKEYFMKLVSQQIEMEAVNVCLMARFLHSAITYIAMKEQIDMLDEKLSEIDLHINIQIMGQYLETVQQNVSIIKKNKVEIDSHADLYKSIAVAALSDCQI